MYGTIVVALIFIFCVVSSNRTFSFYQIEITKWKIKQGTNFDRFIR